ncbi:MAG: T9SS type A sorting domain-containing protein [Bacteroidetes bacterium]|nr:T9SS type A sorting domain-containing protein [Bacteroidota bacterium]MCL5737967.1 T9SS type A sorting domain-containing protein [Bacteroidota bacterium]
MKRYQLLVFASLCVFAAQTFAQNFLKNPGFETWSNNLPASWKTDTIASKKSTTAHSGSTALQFTHSQVFGFLFPAALSQDSIVVSGSTFSLKGWYQFYPDSGDEMSILVTIDGPGGVIGRLVGSGGLDIKAKKTVYTAFSVGIYMAPGTTGDTAIVTIYTLPDTVSGNLHKATYALFDDFVLDNTVTDVKDNEFTLPSNYSLTQNYPNPFNPATEIEFTIPTGHHVTLKVYNMMGQELETLVDEQLPQGRYKKAFDASRLASGVYLYKLQAGNFSQVKKMVLVK